MMVISLTRGIERRKGREIKEKETEWILLARIFNNSTKGVITNNIGMWQTIGQLPMCTFF